MMPAASAKEGIAGARESAPELIGHGAYEEIEWIRRHLIFL
jgi:hypothetical protein